MTKIIKFFFFLLFVKPLTLLVLGINFRSQIKLPKEGPAIIAANHNSHLDTIVLLSLFPLLSLSKVRPVAAADYFLKNKLLSWFSLHIIGIIPLDRSGQTEKEKIFDECHEALSRKEILIIFPEGSRGEAESIGQIKKGLFYLIENSNDIPVIPVVMHGLGMALPKGEALLVPHNCDVIVGDALINYDTPDAFVAALRTKFDELSKFCITKSEKII